ncbi:adenylyl-sulfate kinase [Ralstonia pseudosolanacearum]|uniref:adenylyl-sulfate kinase n=1 Tax=Ralstonia pseudosolanacearum TaxID=1310165 RepID=UPI001FF8A05D
MEGFKMPVDAAGCCYWFTGLSGAGKTTLALHVSEVLRRTGRTVIVLDGDRLRGGLNSDLGFAREDRRENTRRIAEVAKLLVAEGFVVLVSAISPYAEDRRAARARFESGTFHEVFVATDLATCMARDTKGLYARACAGALQNLTGFGDPYEPPKLPEFTIETVQCTVAQAAAPLIEHALESFTAELMANVSER